MELLAFYNCLALRRRATSSWATSYSTNYSIVIESKLGAARGLLIGVLETIVVASVLPIAILLGLPTPRFTSLNSLSPYNISLSS